MRGYRADKVCFYVYGFSGNVELDVISGNEGHVDR